MEPVESGKAVYLSIAPKAADEEALVEIVLRLRITNNESSPVMVSGIRFSFPGSQVARDPPQVHERRPADRAENIIVDALVVGGLPQDFNRL